MSGARFKIQEQQYAFPYHYLPDSTAWDAPARGRHLPWGLEYLCYQRHIREKVISLNPQSVLDVGCGDGFFIGSLPSSVQVRVGVDLSAPAIAFARAFHPELRFEIMHAGQLLESYDVVVAIEVLEHIPDNGVSEFLKCLADRARNAGRVILSVPTDATPVHRKHYRHYNLALFEEELRRSGTPLRIVNVEYLFRSRPWYELFRRLTDNSLWYLDIKPLRGVIWRRIWERHRCTSSHDGRHMVVECVKQPELSRN